MNTNAGSRHLRSAVMVCAAALGLLVAGSAAAQEAKYPSGGPKLPQWSALPDWNGVWERGGDIVWDDSLPYKAGEPQVPPYNAEYMKAYQARRAEMRADALAGRRRNAKGGGLYSSMPAMMIMLFPMDIQINRNEVVIMSSNGGFREIYTDGRVHSDDTLPSSKGHSIGHWEGKTLVVDTRYIRDDTRLPGGGAHSDQMHVIERFSASPDGHALKDAITVEDPKAFTKPWTTVKTYYRRPTWEQVEYDEQENSRDFGQAPPDDGKGFGPPPTAESAPATVAEAPPPPPAPPKAPAKPGKPATTEGLQKATAKAVGNLAWETVVVADVKRQADKVTWNGVTRSVTWRCSAAPDGTKAFCEQ